MCTKYKPKTKGVAERESLTEGGGEGGPARGLKIFLYLGSNVLKTGNSDTERHFGSIYMLQQAIKVALLQFVVDSWFNIYHNRIY